MTSINELCEEAYRIGVAHGWYEGGLPNVGERLALIHSEVSEALEFYRDGRDISIMRSDGVPAEFFLRDDGKPDGYWAEIADIAIRVFDHAGAYGVNLEWIIKRKMKFNEDRPYKHGKIV